MKTNPPLSKAAKSLPPAQKSKAARIRVTIEVDRGLYEEVSKLLKSPAGIGAFGSAAMVQRFSDRANTWLKNVTFALPQGSGYRRAAGVEVIGKGGVA